MLSKNSVLLIVFTLLFLAAPSFAEEIRGGSFWHLEGETDKVILGNPLPENLLVRKGDVLMTDEKQCQDCSLYQNTANPKEVGIIVSSNGNIWRTNGGIIKQINIGGWLTNYPNGKWEVSGIVPEGVSINKGQIHFSDGRICNGCKSIMKGGYVLSVLDSKGFEWELNGATIQVDKHPYLRAYAQASALAAQQYNQQAQYQNLLQQQRQPINVNCNSYGFGNSVSTNCYGY